MSGSYAARMTTRGQHADFPGPHSGIDETHDPNLRSWVASANDPATDFPIQNLPFVRVHHTAATKRNGKNKLCAVIGDRLLDLAPLVEAKLLFDELPTADQWTYPFAQPEALFEVDRDTRTVLRRKLQWLLRADNPVLRDDDKLRGTALIPFDAAIPLLPSSRDEIPNYTDFYASVHHATNVGSMFRPDNPLLPNYKHVPIGYHGRASSIVPSGTSVRRPSGQLPPPPEGGSPSFGPCKQLDYELEVGCVIGRGNELGSPVSIADAESHIFGLCLVNDWSARDMQRWEYQPLGPFLAKNFATTISPYIVTMEALAPFRVPAYERPAGDPAPLEYLSSEANASRGGFDITLEVHLQTAEMAKRGISPVRISKGSFRHMYWTFAQMIAHHTCNGCNLQPGDLLASGTVSGPERESRGSMLELTWDGDPWAMPPKVVPGTQRTPLELPTDEKRTFLQDGDTVILKGYCEREGFRRIGFGECRGTITPA